VGKRYFVDVAIPGSRRRHAVYDGERVFRMDDGAVTAASGLPVGLAAADAHGFPPLSNLHHLFIPYFRHCIWEVLKMFTAMGVRFIFHAVFMSMALIRGILRECWDVLKEWLSGLEPRRIVGLILGVAIFCAAVLALTYVTDFVLKNKIEMRFGLTGFESIIPEMPSFETILMSRLFQLLITLFLVVAVTSLMAFVSGSSWRLLSLLTLVLQSFLVIAVFTCLQLPFIIQIPKASYAIVGASMQNVTFHNATMTGVTPGGRVTIVSEVVKASYVHVFRLYPNMSAPAWSSIPVGDFGRVLGSTVTYMNMTDVTWISRGVEMHLDKLELSSGNWTAVEYGRLVDRLPVRAAGEASLSEYMIDVLSLASTIGLVLYNSIGFRKLYKASMKLTIATGAILFIILMIFGLI